jgi:hypothetical protein
MSEALPLSTRLDDLARVMRRYVASNQRPSVDALAGLFAGLQEMSRAAHALEARLVEMETIARDCDLIAHAKSGEIGAAPTGPVRLSRDASGPDQVTRPGAASIDCAKAERLARDIMALDNTVGDERSAGNLVDLREALTREHREMQRAIEANEQRIEELERRGGCGNDVLIFPYIDRGRITRTRSTCGGPDDGDAA